MVYSPKPLPPNISAGSVDVHKLHYHFTGRLKRSFIFRLYYVLCSGKIKGRLFIQFSEDLAKLCYFQKKKIKDYNLVQFFEDWAK